MPVIINPDVSNGVVFPGMEQWLGGGAQFLVLGAIIFIIAAVCRMRIKKQTENKLTV